MSSTNLEVFSEGAIIKDRTTDARLLAESLLGYSDVWASDEAN
jgi:hypothetical protein